MGENTLAGWSEAIHEQGKRANKRRLEEAKIYAGQTDLEIAEAKLYTFSQECPWKEGCAQYIAFERDREFWRSVVDALKHVEHCLVEV